MAFIVALIAAALWSSDTSAHAYLVRSEPSDGLILSEAPGELRLWFDEPVSGEFSSVQLIDPNGQPIKITSIHGDPADPKLLVVSIPELSQGAYSVLYKALSETDGHFSQGLLVFGVGEEADIGAATAVETAPAELLLPEVGLRWFNFAVLAGTVGALAIAQLVFGSGQSDATASPAVFTVLHSARRRVVMLALGFSTLGLLVGIGLLLWQIRQLMASLPEGANAINVGQQVLIGTRWGHVWLLRQLDLLLLLPVLLWLLKNSLSPFDPTQADASRPAQDGSRQYVAIGSGRRESIVWFLAMVLALALLVAQSLTSHASGLEDTTLLALLADILHLLAASLWVGGLLALSIALVPLLPRQRAELPSIIGAGWKPFSIIAAFSVAVLFATGFYSAGRQVASVDALLTTLYGRTLTAKIAVVILVGAIGLLNSMLLHPRLATPLARVLRRPAGWTPLSLRKLPALAVVEVSAGILVLLITGMVTASPAPRGIEYSLEQEEIRDSLSQTVDDMVITLSAKPNRPGQNVFHVFARSTRRPFVSEIARVILRFDYLGQDVGRTSATAEQVASDRFILGGDYLNLGGEWQIQVVVRRLGLEDSVATFNWIVMPPGDVQPTVVSRQPLEPVLTLAAAAILLLVAIAAAVAWVTSNRHRGSTQHTTKPWKRIAVTSEAPTLSDMNGHAANDLSRVARHHEISTTRKDMAPMLTAKGKAR